MTSLLLVRAGKDQIPPYSVISMSRITGGKHLYGSGEGDSYAKAGIAGGSRENLGIKFHFLQNICYIAIFLVGNSAIKSHRHLLRGGLGNKKKIFLNYPPHPHPLLSGAPLVIDSFL